MNTFSMTQTVISFESILADYEPNSLSANSYRELQEALANFRKNLQNSSNVKEGFNALSERQREILNMIVSGKTNEEIGKVLCITEGTVRSHLRIVYSKCGVANRAQLLKAYYTSKA